MLSIIAPVLSMAAAREASLPPWMKERVEPTLTVLRGIAAVISPKPLLRGVCQADVDVVCP
eukprot:6028244-Lingulodinium_polyedra.AAC.1